MPKSRIPKYIVSHRVKHLPSISSNRVEGTKECYSGPFYVQFPVIYIGASQWTSTTVFYLLIKQSFLNTTFQALTYKMKSSLALKLFIT